MAGARDYDEYMPQCHVMSEMGSVGGGPTSMMGTCHGRATFTAAALAITHGAYQLLGVQCAPEQRLPWEVSKCCHGTAGLQVRLDCNRLPQRAVLASAFVLIWNETRARKAHARILHILENKVWPLASPKLAAFF